MLNTEVVYIPEKKEMLHGHLVTYHLHEIHSSNVLDRSSSENLAYAASTDAEILRSKWLAHEQDPASIYWFRWVSGHQVAFISWVLIIEEINQFRLGIKTQEMTEAICAALFRLYSSMLVYTASTTPEVYESTIRRFMTTFNPSFSGTWAADYGQLKKYMKSFGIRDSRFKEVRQAYFESIQMHGKIGKRLIGDAASLLQLSKETDAQEARPLDEDLEFTFDSFFLVRRAQVSSADMLNQLTSRLADIVTDCKVNGFTVGDSTPPDDEALAHYWSQLPKHATDAVNLLTDSVHYNLAEQVAA